MRAVLKSLDLDPDPSSLPDSPAEFSLRAQMMVGPTDAAGEESFELTVCTPQWLAALVARDGIYDARHYVIVDFETFDRTTLHSWLTKRVEAVQQILGPRSPND